MVLKKTLIVAFVVLILIAASMLYMRYDLMRLHRVHIFTSDPISENKTPANPGWFEQWFEMKKDETGKIPRGITQMIHKQQQQNVHRGNNGLFNINELGPSNVGGRTRAFMIDRLDSSHFLAGGVSGGVWQTFNSGTTWEPLTDNYSTLSVMYITQDPDSQNIIYFCTGEPRGNSTGIPGDGVFKSIDTGKTFTHLPATSGWQFDYIWTVKASLTELNTIYIGTADSGIYKSTDGGASFTQVFAINKDDVSDIETFPDGSVMISVRNRGIYKSPNGNAGTFMKLTNGLPADGFRRCEIAYCDSTPSVIYVQFEDSGSSSYYSSLKGIWKSTDGGTSWAPTVGNPDADFSISYTFPWYCFLFEVHPTNPDIVISGGVRIAYTTDGGTIWTKAYNTHADNHIAVFDVNDPDNFYVGNDGGVYKYNINTANAVGIDLNNGYNVTQFYTGAYFPYGVQAFGGTQDNGTQATRNGNSNFDHIYGGDGAFTQVNQQDANYSYVSYQNGQIKRSANSFATFPAYSDIKNELDADNNGSIDEGAGFINPFYINNLDGNQLYFVTNERIWITTNKGTNWDPLTDTIGKAFGGDKPYAVGISSESNPTIYIGGQDMMFWRFDKALTNLPGTETNLSLSTPNNSSWISCLRVHPSDNNVLYAGLSNFSTSPRIYKITDAKTNTPTWIDISGDLPTYLPVNSVESNPSNPDSFLIAATDYGLYVTQNGGVNWVREDSIPNVSIHQIHLRHNDGTLFIFTHGRGVWTARLTGTFTGTSLTNIKRAHLLAYPNPATDYIRLDQMPYLEGSIVTIYDLVGREVKDIIATSDGRIHVADLTRGMYLFRLMNDDQIYLGKFMKL